MSKEFNNADEAVLYLLKKICEKLDIDTNNYVSIPCRQCKEHKLIKIASTNLDQYCTDFRLECKKCGNWQNNLHDNRYGWIT